MKIVVRYPLRDRVFKNLQEAIKEYALDPSTRTEDANYFETPKGKRIEPLYAHNIKDTAFFLSSNSKVRSGKKPQRENK